MSVLSDADLSCSGDQAANRRYAYAEGLRARGDAAAAAEVLEQALELAPRWPTGWFALGRARAEAGDKAGARAAYQEAMRLDPQDRLGAALKLALLGQAPAPAAPPPGYVRALFDDYAPRFDSALREGLGYVGPEAIAALLNELAPGRRFARALDLGCGTGLAAETLRPVCDHLEGVDLSGAMLERARAKGLYEALHQAEAAAFLKGASGWNLIVAADMLPYLGDLEPFLVAAGQAAAPGALMILTAQALPEGDYALGPDHRYAHGPAYLAQSAEAAGWRRRALRPAVLRRDGGTDVASLIAAFERIA